MTEPNETAAGRTGTGVPASYHVPRPDAHVHRGVAIGAVVSAALLVVAAMLAYAPIRVTVDGQGRKVLLGATADKMVDAGYTSAVAGDLLAVDGTMLSKGGGAAPALLVDGRRARPDERVSDGARVQSVRGGDVTETVETTLIATPIPVVEEGRGPDAALSQIGSPGIARAQVGAVSRTVIASATVETATPMVIVRSGELPSGRLVALTFDDGPWPGQTDAILKILADNQVKATFFMLGIRVRADPEIAKRVAEAGHVIGNHSQSHVLLASANERTIRFEMTAGAQSIEQVTGVRPTWFRAPGGSVGPATRARAKALGERIIGWGVDPADWSRPPARFIVRRVMAQMRPGAVVLMHDGGGDRTQTIGALPEIIRQLRAQGYSFVTLDEMYGKR